MVNVWRAAFIVGLLVLLGVVYLVIDEALITRLTAFAGAALFFLNMAFGSADQADSSFLRKSLRQILSVNRYSQTISVAFFIASAGLLVYHFETLPPTTYTAFGRVSDAAGLPAEGIPVTISKPSGEDTRVLSSELGEFQATFLEEDLSGNSLVKWIDPSNNESRELPVASASIRAGQLPEISLLAPLPPFDVKYVTFRGVAASYIADGKAPPNSQELLRSNPKIVVNSTLRELQQFIRNFGTDTNELFEIAKWVQADGRIRSETQWSPESEERDDIVGTIPKAYLGGEGRFENPMAFAPENLSLYRNLGESDRWPDGYSIYCDHDRPVLWRELKGSDVAEIASLNAITDGVIADGFSIAVWSGSQCEGYSLSVPMRNVEVSALVLENLSDEPLRVDALLGQQYSGPLRPADATDSAFASTGTLESLQFPPDYWRPGEFIVLPLRVQFSFNDASFSDFDRCPKLGKNWCRNIKGQISEDGLLYGTPFGEIRPDKTGPCPPRKVPEVVERFDYGTSTQPRSLKIRNIEYEIREPSPVVLAMLGNFGYGSCPHVFSYQPEVGVWRNLGTILRGALGANAQRVDEMAIADPREPLQLRELEPEIAFIDAVELIVRYPDGREQTLSPRNKDLDAADGSFVVLNQGDRISLDFDHSNVGANYESATLRANGYYLRYGTAQYKGSLEDGAR